MRREDVVKRELSLGRDPSGDGAGDARPSEERRNMGRVSTTFAVSERDGSQVHLCQAEDIAIGGMTIKHAKGLAHEPRTEVSLRFSLPGSTEEIEARGEIVSDARAGRFRRTGVRFIAVRPEHQQLIAAYCRRR
jgi:c-di-GMP-binding flagellar brake protein YcgR